MVEVADGAANGQSVLRELCGATRTNEKRHVATRLKQTPAEIAADCARSNNQNSHVTQTLSFKERRRRTVPARGCTLRHGGDQHERGEDYEMHGSLQHGRSAGAKRQAAI